MDQYILDTVHTLRTELHGLAERSGKEPRTKSCLMEFLRAHPSLRLDDGGAFFCAVLCGTGRRRINRLSR